MYVYGKTTRLLWALLILICSIAFCLLGGANKARNNALMEGIAVSQSQKGTGFHIEQENLNLSKHDPEIVSQRHLSAADVNNIKSWELAHGYFELSDLQEYNSYSFESLDSLAQNGDLKALQLISERNIKNGDLDAAFKNFKLAAIYGSTQALSAYSIFYGIYFRKSSVQEVKEAYAINALAFLAVAARRGDSYAELHGIADFQKEYGFYPSPDQRKAIEIRASEVYTDLESLRAGLGLPEFDNAPNAAAQRAYNNGLL